MTGKLLVNHECDLPKIIRVPTAQNPDMHKIIWICDDCHAAYGFTGCNYHFEIDENTGEEIKVMTPSCWFIWH